MSTEDRSSPLERRVEEIERRLAAIESRLADRMGDSPAGRPAVTAEPLVKTPEPPAGGAPPTERTPSGAAVADTPPIVDRPAVERKTEGRGQRIPYTALVLGWAGTAALVLAAAYLVRLGIEYGWITPLRQVLAAAVFGSAMIVGGLALRLGDRPYASLLGAGGVAVLYLAVFGAHLYHHLIGATIATGLAIAVAGVSLGLHAVFRAHIYVAFSVAGSYATPLLVQGQGSATDLALYLAIWDLVYCAYAAWMRSRRIILAALYGSLVVFQIAWVEIGMPGWPAAAGFQLFQFGLFVGMVIALSTRIGKPMDAGLVVLHAPALFLFYGLEYAILDAHAPALAPWAMLGFAVALYAAWLTARRLLAEPPGASLVLIHGFAGLVLVHAVYIDALPARWRPLAALALTVSTVLAGRARRDFGNHGWPLYVAAGVLFVAGSAELYSWVSGGRYVGDVPLYLACPALLYGLYFTRSVHADPTRYSIVLGVAHLLLMAACALLIERWIGEPTSTIDRLWLSLSWAVIGVSALAIAVGIGDRLLARSALGVFLVFALKVLAIDLDEAVPLVRVGTLLVLGGSLYAGGWIYRRLLPRETFSGSAGASAGGVGASVDSP